jgi:hypothetical protein
VRALLYFAVVAGRFQPVIRGPQGGTADAAGQKTQIPSPQPDNKRPAQHPAGGPSCYRDEPQHPKSARLAHSPRAIPVLEGGRRHQSAPRDPGAQPPLTRPAKRRPFRSRTQRPTQRRKPNQSDHPETSPRRI